MRRETESFFANLVQEDRSLLDLFQADYTFLNERLALHYGIRESPAGSSAASGIRTRPAAGFLPRQRLVLTSLANRTSPVLRGKWVMEVLMGTPPPPPPPDTPVLEDIEEVADGRRLTTRERMEMHAATRAATRVTGS